MGRRIALFLPAAALPLVLLSAACPLGESVRTLRVTPSQASMDKEGDTFDINAEPLDRFDKTVKAIVFFKSRDPEIATVSSIGRVTAVGHGTTTIDVTVDGTELVEFVRVSIRLPGKVEVRPTSTTVAIGAVRRLEAKVLDRGGKEIPSAELEWSTSDSKIAWVDNGEVTGITVGHAVITAKALGMEGTSEIDVLLSAGMKGQTKTSPRGGGGGGGRRGGSGSGGGGSVDPRLSMFDD